MPDTFGLQEYYVTDVITEVTGTDTRFVCGARHDGTVYWLYSVVMPTDLVMPNIWRCEIALAKASLKEI